MSTKQSNKHKKYELPGFLSGKCAQKTYDQWLISKAKTHVRRDKRRGANDITPASYKVAIHNAVLESGGLDAYTGRQLDWKKISTFDNDSAKAEGRKYMKKYALLPTVDHISSNRSGQKFKICSWIVNDCKSHLSLDEFKEVCRAVLNYSKKN